MAAEYRARVSSPEREAVLSPLMSARGPAMSARRVVATALPAVFSGLSRIISLPVPDEVSDEVNHRATAAQILHRVTSAAPPAGDEAIESVVSVQLVNAVMVAPAVPASNDSLHPWIELFDQDSQQVYYENLEVLLTIFPLSLHFSHVLTLSYCMGRVFSCSSTSDWIDLLGASIHALVADAPALPVEDADRLRVERAVL